MFFTNNTHAAGFAKDPAVVRLDNQFYLYHSVPPADDFSGWSIGIAKSDDLISWQVISRLLPTQNCEKNGLCAPGAIVIENKVHLFYQTYGNGKNDAICHAVSDDGINFTKDITNPVFSPNGNWCCKRAIDADVCIFKGKLYMYFATRDHKMKIQKIGAAVAELSSDYSRSAWKPLVDQSILTPELEWEGECIEAPACIVYKDNIYMFYGGSYNCTPQQIGCAVSSDGVHFERISDKPFLKNGPKGSWNQSESGHPFIFRNDEDIYLFYQGSPDNGKSWCISCARIDFRDNYPYICD